MGCLQIKGTFAVWLVENYITNSLIGSYPKNIYMNLRFHNLSNSDIFNATKVIYDDVIFIQSN